MSYYMNQTASLNSSHIDTKACSYLWTITNYSAILTKPNTRLRSEKFAAAGDSFNWCLEHTVFEFAPGRSFVAFKLCPDSYVDLEKRGTVSGNVCVLLMELDTRTSFKVERPFVFKYSDPEVDFCGSLPGIDSEEVEKFIRGDKLLIRCNVTCSKENQITSISTSNNSTSAGISECRVLIDLEKCYIDDHFKDVTISVKGKEYRAHKIILATRCSVFERMLRVDMSESKNNRVDITDMEQDVFEEVLYYIYTGKVKNLNELAFELLPVADRYDLKELRIMCEEALLEQLSAKNAVKILILADMHRAEELKAHTLRFIKQNYKICEDFNDADIWKNLAAHNYQLMKDMLSAFCKN
ncbi:speckle-type POZ protein-like [Planococcus citri]|uniref:speckle-type POZ protein-like n=1 Tax=Planococcus citri TaxID=170843 RepID=UPI0031F9A060